MTSKGFTKLASFSTYHLCGSRGSSCGVFNAVSHWLAVTHWSVVPHCHGTLHTDHVFYLCSASRTDRSDLRQTYQHNERDSFQHSHSEGAYMGRQLQRER